MRSKIVLVLEGFDALRSKIEAGGHAHPYRRADVARIALSAGWLVWRGLRVSGADYRVWGLGFRVWG